jgi:short-subunit dehydrogenase
MFEYRARTALVTGASSGIGAAFARALAERGMNVVLVARSDDALRRLADELTAQHSVRAEVVRADLSDPSAVETVRQEIEQRGLTVDLLVNNAGFATHGHFESLSASRDQEQIMVNVAALVGLTHAFLPGMLSRGGAIVNVASTAAFQPIPFMAVYAASKAFVVSFSRALAEEVRGRDVRIVTLCPGPTDTAFFEVCGSKEAAVGQLRSVDQVVATGLRALERGRHLVVDGAVNSLAGFMARILPSSFTSRMAGRVARPRDR